MCVNKAWNPISLLTITTAVLVAGGCVVSVIPDDTTPSSPATTIAVRIVNNTSKPLDPQIYIGGVPDEGAEGLFVAGLKKTDFGVGSLGIMLPRTETSFSVNCGALGLFGTQGGIFGDDLQDPLGAGKQVVLQENVNVGCGDQVTFAFSAQGSTLITSYAVSLQGD